MLQYCPVYPDRHPHTSSPVASISLQIPSFSQRFFKHTKHTHAHTQSKKNVKQECSRRSRLSGVSCLFTRITCPLAAHPSAEARAQLYGAPVDPSPRVSDVIVLQMQRLVALLYKTNHRNEARASEQNPKNSPTHQNSTNIR